MAIKNHSKGPLKFIKRCNNSKMKSNNSLFTGRKLW